MRIIGAMLRLISKATQLFDQQVTTSAATWSEKNPKMSLAIAAPLLGYLGIGHEEWTAFWKMMAKIATHLAGL